MKNSNDREKSIYYWVNLLSILSFSGKRYFVLTGKNPAPFKKAVRTVLIHFLWEITKFLYSHAVLLSHDIRISIYLSELLYHKSGQCKVESSEIVLSCRFPKSNNHVHPVIFRGLVVNFLQFIDRLMFNRYWPFFDTRVLSNFHHWSPSLVFVQYYT